MASNQKLTTVLQGRTITHSIPQDATLTVEFDDGSVMTVQTGGEVGAGVVGKTITGVRQSGTRLSLDFADNSAWDITTAEPTASVMVRDKDHVMVYAD